MSNAKLYYTWDKVQKTSDPIMAEFHQMLALNIPVSVSGVTKDLGFPLDFQNYNEMIGWPLNRNIDKPQQMAWFQLLYHYDIQQYHREQINKTRKGGFTETVDRSVALNVFDRYLGHDFMVVAGNELRIAKEIIIRFDELFKDKPQADGAKYAFKDPYGNKWHHDDLIRKANFGQEPLVEFFNDTRVFGFAASKQGQRQSFRGPDDIIGIFVSEAAHTGMSDDYPLVNALEPNLANRDYGDIIYESTPNGKRGFFYDRAMRCEAVLNQYQFATDEERCQKLMELVGWNYRVFPYTVALDVGIISQKFIDHAKKDPEVDFEQEYMCKFTTTKKATFDEKVIEEAEKALGKHTSVDLSKELGYE